MTAVLIKKSLVKLNKLFEIFKNDKLLNLSHGSAYLNSLLYSFHLFKRQQHKISPPLLLCLIAYLNLF